MTTITANIPASEWTDARIDTFEKTENGTWVCPIRGTMFDDDVIDVCKKASNWKSIRQLHFPMSGFHADDFDFDNTPYCKGDF